MTVAARRGTPVALDRARDELRARVRGPVRFDPGHRALYSTDASNFRQVPLGVVQPRDPDDVVAAVAVCHALGLPVVNRGGGTSLAGQCTNTAVVLDLSRHCNRLVSVDPDARRCVVEPGIVLDDLNAQLAEHGLRFGPEPATHANCTLGGMIGNNSCGATAQRTGKVVDNVARLEVLLHDGTRFWCGAGDACGPDPSSPRATELYDALRRLAADHADLVRERFPDIPRRVSGYNLDSLLPEHDFDVAGFLVGSESTLVTVLRAELELVPVVPAKALVVLGFPDIATAADAVPAIVEHEPIALEGVDHYLIADQQLKGMNAEAIARLPDGRGYLMVQLGGQDEAEADRRARRLIEALGHGDHDPDVAVIDDPSVAKELWAVRESGLGATAHVPYRPDTFEGWEDSAVPVDRLGDYLRDLRQLYVEFGYASDTGPSLYGHFGQGCVHTRIPFDLYSTEGVRQYREFMESAADLVVRYGGSLSGEHGDGQSRGELLVRMFGPEVVALFERVKDLFDPDNLMNPGKVVRAAGLDQHLRLGGDWAPRQPRPLHFTFAEDGHSFAQAANRCVGVGRCRQTSPTRTGEVMCPSYQVTREEQHSTRGRSRLLFEMLDGHGDGPVTDGWRSTEVRDALDLCLACKGCKSDCPADVDMATYKAEFLAQHYRGRLRPRADYATGWLPAVARAVERLHLAGIVNAAGRRRVLRRLATRLAGLEDRELPEFAGTTLQQWWRERLPAVAGRRGRVLLWPDTFTNRFHPHVGQAAVTVLEAAGWEVEIPDRPVCCGLTWISTGQLGTARRRLHDAVRTLAPHVRDGGLVVGLEPSCTAVFRSDGPDLLAEDQDVRRVADHVVTLAELLDEHTDGWTPPDAPPQQALAQVHCHQHAVLGWDADRRVLDRAGVTIERLDSGCCGLAGNFGFTAGHGEVSAAIAEQALLPRLRAAEPGTAVLADGFSCRTQIHELDSGGHEGIHLAELLARRLESQVTSRVTDHVTDQAHQPGRTLT